jgi:HEAT repeat protein
MRKWLGGLLALAIVAVAAADGAEVRELVAKLKSNDSDARRAAAKDLGELGADAKSAVPDLIKALNNDKDLFVRRFAAEALGAIGPDAVSAVPDLGKALNDSRKEVQLAAADALGKLGEASIKVLTSAVKDGNKDPEVRRKAAQGLGKIGKPAHSSVSALTMALKGKVARPAKGKRNDDDIRIDVATALGEVANSEDTAAIAALKAVSEGKQRNKGLQKAASEALQKITGEAPPKKKKKKN